MRPRLISRLFAFRNRGQDLFQAVLRLRLRILGLLSGREVCVCDLMAVLGEPQPKVSQHLAFLRAAGLVVYRQEGKWRHYALVKPAGKVHASLVGCLGEEVFKAWLTEQGIGFGVEVRPPDQPDHADLWLADGRSVDMFIEHVVGSVERPMSDADLEAKFLGLAEGVLPADRTRRLIDLCWRVEELPGVAAVAAASQPAA